MHETMETTKDTMNDEDENYIQKVNKILLK